MQMNKYIKLSSFKNPIILGTLLLTLAGFLTKIIGFFYKIFLSRIFHEEGLGIIGLISPVLVLVHSISITGLQNAITKYVAAARNEKSNSAYSYLFTGILLSVSLSAIMGWGVYHYADFIAASFLNEYRCCILLRVAALSFPLAALHSCINGFFFAYKKTGVPAFTMLVEQLARVCSVYLLYQYAIKHNTTVSLAASSIGLFSGECVSAVFSCLFLILWSKKNRATVSKDTYLLSFQRGSALCKLSFPLSLNRICISLLSTLETTQLPGKLIASGLTSSQALSIYGIFSGMAFPLIMFPCALTGSAASLMLPTISEAQAAGNKKRIKQLIMLTVLFGFLLGIGCMVFFLSFADLLGKYLFQNSEVASQIRALSLVCPFLYLSGMLNSILHGLGKTTISFIFSVISVVLRLFFVLYVIPVIGFRGYLYGILSSQICLDLLNILALRHYIIYN